MAEEGLEMSELLFFAICFLALALTLCYLSLIHISEPTRPY